MSAAKAQASALEPGMSRDKLERAGRMKKKAVAARKATRETYRIFSRLSGVDSNTAALMTVAWATLMDGSFEGDGR